jgi:hypothetical protein
VLAPNSKPWCRFTGNPLLEATVENGRARWVFRCEAARVRGEDKRPVGSRLWLYTNFDCNLRCDYCCVCSSPTAPRRELGLRRIQRIAGEAAELGVKEIFVTGGEPFLLEVSGEILLACAAATQSVWKHCPEIELSCKSASTVERQPARPPSRRRIAAGRGDRGFRQNLLPQIQL